MQDGHQMWPVAQAPLSVVIALSTERAETAKITVAGVASSYRDQHDEEYPLHACFPETVAPPVEGAASRMQSEDILAAAAEHLASGGLDPAEMVPAEENFRSRDEMKREA
eukprot:5719507-Alexandrium_andersonii.AAC.1